MGLTGSKRRSTKEPDTFKAAGTMFYSDRHVLAAWQGAKRPSPYISGLGGKRNDGESFMETALRETIEELFDVESVPTGLIRELEEIRPQHVDIGKYVNVVYTFDQLVTMLHIMRKHLRTSKLYAKFPLTMSDLILNRRVLDGVEISHLCLLPKVRGVYVHKEFIADIDELIRGNE